MWAGAGRRFLPVAGMAAWRDAGTNDAGSSASPRSSLTAVTSHSAFPPRTPGCCPDSASSSVGLGHCLWHSLPLCLCILNIASLAAHPTHFAYLAQLPPFHSSAIPYQHGVAFRQHLPHPWIGRADGPTTMGRHGRGRSHLPPSCQVLRRAAPYAPTSGLPSAAHFHSRRARRFQRTLGGTYIHHTATWLFINPIPFCTGPCPHIACPQLGHSQPLHTTDSTCLASGQDTTTSLPAFYPCCPLPSQWDHTCSNPTWVPCRRATPPSRSTAYASPSCMNSGVSGLPGAGTQTSPTRRAARLCHLTCHANSCWWLRTGTAWRAHNDALFRLAALPASTAYAHAAAAAPHLPLPPAPEGPYTHCRLKTLLNSPFPFPTRSPHHTGASWTTTGGRVHACLHLTLRRMARLPAYLTLPTHLHYHLVWAARAELNAATRAGDVKNKPRRTQLLNTRATAQRATEDKTRAPRRRITRAFTPALRPSTVARSARWHPPRYAKPPPAAHHAHLAPRRTPPPTYAQGTHTLPTCCPLTGQRREHVRRWAFPAADVTLRHHLPLPLHRLPPATLLPPVPGTWTPARTHMERTLPFYGMGYAATHTCLRRHAVTPLDDAAQHCRFATCWRTMPGKTRVAAPAPHYLHATRTYTLPPPPAWQRASMRVRTVVLALGLPMRSSHYLPCRQRTFVGRTFYTCTAKNKPSRA